MRRLILAGFLLALGGGYLASSIVALKHERDRARTNPVQTGVPAQSARVILIVLDGVPVRVAFDDAIMPNLVGLANRGLRGVLRSPEPTTTTVGVRALATGMTPTPADVLDIFASDEFKGWTVFDEVVQRGQSVSLVGEKTWISLLGSRDSLSRALAQIDTRLYENPKRVMDFAALRLRSPQPPALSVVHLNVTDELGHLHGTTGPIYSSSMRAVDEILERFLAEATNDSTTILITADHGADIYGSHGGEGEVYRNVPLVMIGSAIRAGRGVLMDARALPGVIAVLLGTRIPGGAQAVLPVDVFDLPDTLRAKIVAANATQLEALARARNVPLPLTLATNLKQIGLLARTDASSAVRLASETLPVLAAALDQYSQPNLIRLEWFVVILGAVALGAVWTLSSTPGSSLATNAAVVVAAALVGISVLFPQAATLSLPTVAATELALIAVWVRRMRGSVLLGLIASLGVFALPAIRFALMPQIKRALQAPAMRAAMLIAVAVAVFALFSPRAKAALKESGASKTLAIALFLLAVALLAPFTAVAVVLIAASVLALSVSLGWLALGTVGLGLAIFFFFGERIADTIAHESLGPRYLLIAAVVLTLAGISRKLLDRWGSPIWWIWASLLWLVPFGHVRLPAIAASPLISTFCVVVAISGAVGLAVFRGVRDWWCYMPLISTLTYHLQKTHPIFWIGMAVHAGVLMANTIGHRPFASRQSVVTVTSISALILMSPSTDAPSAMLLVLGLTSIARLEPGELPASALALLGAAIVVYTRYTFVDIFAHTATSDCTLRCIDEASGFLGFSEIRWTWASLLVSLKMLIATVAIYSIVWSNPTFALVRPTTLVASLLLVTAFIGKSALEAGFSFGIFGARLGDSMSHAGFHTIMLFTLGLGYLLYKLVTPPDSATKPIVAMPTGDARANA